MRNIFKAICAIAVAAFVTCVAVGANAAQVGHPSGIGYVDDTTGHRVGEVVVVLTVDYTFMYYGYGAYDLGDEIYATIVHPEDANGSIGSYNLFIDTMEFPLMDSSNTQGTDWMTWYSFRSLYTGHLPTGGYVPVEFGRYPEALSTIDGADFAIFDPGLAGMADYTFNGFCIGGPAGVACGTVDYVAPETTMAPTPIPGAVWLLGTGLLALVSFARRKAA